MINEIRILLIEDDYLQAKTIQSGLQERLRGEYPNLSFEVISTESEFYDRFEKIAQEGFRIIIIDVMLRWASPSPDMPMPLPEVIEGGFFRAGLRCQQKLALDARTSSIPTIIYTVLDESQLPALPTGVKLVAKSGDLHSLAEEIRRTLRPLSQE